MSATATSAFATTSYIDGIVLQDAGYVGEKVEYIDYGDAFRKPLLRFLAGIGQVVPKDLFDGYWGLVNEFASYGLLPEGWDGPGSRPATIQAFGEAFYTVLCLLERRVRAPKSMLHSDGTIGVYWRRINHYASIDFEEDGEHIWVVTDGRKSNSGTWKARIEDSLPPEFKDATS